MNEVLDTPHLLRCERHARYEITVGDSTRHILVAYLGQSNSGEGQRYGVQIDDGEVLVVHASRPVQDVVNLLVGTAAWEAGLVDAEDGFEVEILGIRHEVAVVDPRRKALRQAAVSGGAVIKTMMPGRVVRVLVAEGDAVAKGDPVIVVEAMKMENELKAPRDGTIKRISSGTGTLVDAGAVLVELD